MSLDGRNQWSQLNGVFFPEKLGFVGQKAPLRQNLVATKILLVDLLDSDVDVLKAMFPCASTDGTFALRLYIEEQQKLNDEAPAWSGLVETGWAVKSVDVHFLGLTYHD